MSIIKPKKEQPVSGKVIERTGVVYRIRTASGRITTAISKENWAVGSLVTVLNGAIIGAAGSRQPSKVYQV